MTDTPGRLLRLLSLLQTRRDWPGPELAARLEVSARTVRRDVERLRELGYPVRATIGSVGGYRLEAGTAMPPLLLDDEEAVAIAVGLRTAAGGSVAGIEETSVRALAKLEQVLPTRLRNRVGALQAATVRLTAHGPTVDPGTLTTIAAACRDQERLRFRYQSREASETTNRLTEPLRLVSAGRRWYLVAWDVDREAWRSFRVDRIEAPQATGVRFTPRDLPAEDAAAYVAQNLSSWQARYSAVVTVHAPVASVADRVASFEGELEPIDEQTCRWRTGADSLEWLVIRVGLLGFEVEVREPPELADLMTELGHRFIRAGSRTC